MYFNNRKVFFAALTIAGFCFIYYGFNIPYNYLANSPSPTPIVSAVPGASTTAVRDPFYLPPPDKLMEEFAAASKMEEKYLNGSNLSSSTPVDTFRDKYMVFLNKGGGKISISDRKTLVADADKLWTERYLTLGDLKRFKLDTLSLTYSGKELERERELIIEETANVVRKARGWDPILSNSPMVAAPLINEE